MTAPKSPAAGEMPGHSSATLHVIAAVWVLGMLAFARASGPAYEASMQEDRFVEWWTVVLFAGAGAFALSRALRERRMFDGLVGLFCLFVAGEEFSWGQRLLGFVPPNAFLEHNKQQELTLHNFTAIVSEPKWILIMAMAGFGLLLPLLARTRRASVIAGKLGASVPRAATSCWFAVAVAVLIWYPVSYTGEWVEALAGGLFLVAFAPRPSVALKFASIGVAGAVALAMFSGRQAGTAEQLACARAETRALVDDLVQGTAATERLARASSVHKRIWTAGSDGYLEPGELTAFSGARCDSGASGPDATRRISHAIDPWGTAYWLETRHTDAGRLVRVYSFGPNRRRDGDRGTVRKGGDDVAYSVVLPQTPDTATGRSRPVLNGGNQ